MVEEIVTAIVPIWALPVTRKATDATTAWTHTDTIANTLDLDHKTSKCVESPASVLSVTIEYMGSERIRDRKLEKRKKKQTASRQIATMNFCEGAWAKDSRALITVGNGLENCHCTWTNYNVLDLTQGYTCLHCWQSHRYLCAYSLYTCLRTVIISPTQLCRTCHAIVARE